MTQSEDTLLSDEFTLTHEKPLYDSLTPKDLASWLDNNNTNNFAIIDVRTNDFGPEKIKNAFHHPFDQFTSENSINKIIQKYKNVSQLVFHCAYSQVRGPTSAGRYIKLLNKHNNNLKNPNNKIHQKIFLLNGGFNDFFRIFPIIKYSSYYEIINTSKNKNEIVELKYIKSDILKDWIDNKISHQIIDVRDSDFGPKKIKGAINIPAYKFGSKLKFIANSYKNIENIVIHCHYSQSRGPSCAEMYIKYIRNSDEMKDQKVYVLYGGFKHFSKLYKHYCVFAD